MAESIDGESLIDVQARLVLIGDGHAARSSVDEQVAVLGEIFAKSLSMQ
jgi:hypothetical protein